MTEPWNFFIKQKMFKICYFHNKFSNSGPYDLLEWVPDGPEHHGHKIGFRAACEGSIWNFIEPGALFWVYATAARRCFDPANTWCTMHPPTTYRDTLILANKGFIFFLNPLKPLFPQKF